MQPYKRIEVSANPKPTHVRMNTVHHTMAGELKSNGVEKCLTCVTHKYSLLSCLVLLFTNC